MGMEGLKNFLYFLFRLKNKGDSLSEEILENYRIFNDSDYGESLKKFEEYEHSSCERKYKGFDKKKIDVNDKSGVNPNILQEAQRLLEQVRESLEKYQEERLHHLQETSFPPSEEETTY